METDIFKKYPVLNKISISLIQDIIEDKGFEFSHNSTYSQMGFDDLDYVEMIMEIEKRLNIVIDDDMAEIVFSLNSTPMYFLQKMREEKINEVLK